MQLNWFSATAGKTPGKPTARLLAALLLFSAASFKETPALGQKMELLPSTPAGVDCAWKPFDSPALGLRMLVQDCSTPERQYILSTRGNAIYYRGRAGYQAGVEQKIIEVFTKPVDTPVQNAIYQRFVGLSQAYKNAGCEVRDIRDLLFLGREQITYDIFPLGRYGYPSELTEKGDAYSVCGDYGFKADNSRFFAFHPDEDKTKYLFISMPVNKSLFDPLSILLYPGAQRTETITKATPTSTPPSPMQMPATPEPIAQHHNVEVLDWRPVERAGAVSYFINAHAAVDAASGYVTSEVLVDSGPRSSRENLAGLPDGAASKIEQVTIDCKSRRYKTERADLYRENMGKGAVVRHFDQRAGWSFAPGYYLKVFDRLCVARD